MKFADDEIMFGARMGDEQCASEFNRFKGFQEVSCRKDYIEDSDFVSYVFSINKFAVYPFENNIFNHSGNPSLTKFSCDLSFPDKFQVEDPYCEIADVIAEDLPGICSHEQVIKN